MLVLQVNLKRTTWAHVLTLVKKWLRMGIRQVMLTLRLRQQWVLALLGHDNFVDGTGCMLV